MILFVIANAFPFLSLKVQGQATSSHLMSGAIDLWRDGMPEIAIAVILFVVVFPLGKILIGVAVVGPLAMGRSFRGAPAIYRLYSRLHPWAMMEIFMLGVLVAYTKLIALATVEVGPALISFVAAILVLIAADNSIDPHDVWERLKRSAPLRLPGRRERHRLVGCHTCGLVCELPDPVPVRRRRSSRTARAAAPSCTAASPTA